MAKEVKKKSAKKASDVFHGIMKASVSVPVKPEAKKKQSNGKEDTNKN